MWSVWALSSPSFPALCDLSFLTCERGESGTVEMQRPVLVKGMSSRNDSQGQGSANYGPWAYSSLPPDFLWPAS